MWPFARRSQIGATFSATETLQNLSNVRYVSLYASISALGGFGSRPSGPPASSRAAVRALNAPTMVAVVPAVPPSTSDKAGRSCFTFAVRYVYTSGGKSNVVGRSTRPSDPGVRLVPVHRPLQGQQIGILPRNRPFSPVVGCWRRLHSAPDRCVVPQQRRVQAVEAGPLLLRVVGPPPQLQQGVASQSHRVWSCERGVSFLYVQVSNQDKNWNWCSPSARPTT